MPGPAKPGLVIPARRLGPERLAWASLGAAMLVAAGMSLYFGRGSSFSVDEMVWVAAAGHFDFQSLFDAHGGHLQLISRGIYKVLLEIFGTGYLPFRILTVLSLWFTVALLFAHLARRVGHWVALAPCLVLLFFGSDSLHLLRGNGFTILLSIAFGLIALRMLDRGDRRGDLIAAVALVLGVVTYGVALAFVAGAAAFVLLGPDRWRRLWVPALPLLVYGSWKVWLQLSDTFSAGGGIEPANVLLIPAWIFQALASTLGALTALDYPFAGEVDAGTLAGPGLALAALVGLAFCLSRTRISRSMWTALTIGLVLWASQSLVTVPELVVSRTPDDPRYLVPGAVVVFLIAAEAIQGIRWNRNGLFLLFVIALAGVAGNVMLMKDQGALYRIEANRTRATVGAFKIGMESATAAAPTPASAPDPSRQIAVVLSKLADLPFGELALGPDEISGLTPDLRVEVDQIISRISPPVIKKLPSGTTGCRSGPPVRPGSGTLPVPARGLVIADSGGGGPVRAARFGDQAVIDLGDLRPGRGYVIKSPEDSVRVPWRISIESPTVHICPR